MKKTFLFLIVIICLGSCNNKEKYQGKWTYNYLNSTNIESDIPSKMIIKNDYIEFNYPYFDLKNKYFLKVEKKKLTFNNWSLSTDLRKDTLILNSLDYFIQDENDSVFKSLWNYPITKINLPTIDIKIFFEKNFNNRYAPEYHILFGRRIDNNAFSLQLNDKYESIKNIPAFISIERSSFRCELTPFPFAVLFLDKKSPMKFIEDIFYHLKIVNQLKISFVNDIHLTYNDSLGLHYEHERLTKRLPPFRENDNYHTNTSAPSYSVPPPPLYFPRFDNKKPDPKLILLKNKALV